MTAQAMIIRRDSPRPLTLDELDLASDSQLLGFAEDYDLLGFLQRSPQRPAYLLLAENAERHLSAFLGARPDRSMWRAEVAIPLLDPRGDFRSYIRRSYAQNGSGVLRDRAESDALALALADIIVAVYVLERSNA